MLDSPNCWQFVQIIWNVHSLSNLSVLDNTIYLNSDWNNLKTGKHIGNMFLLGISSYIVALYYLMWDTQQNTLKLLWEQIGNK